MRYLSGPSTSSNLVVFITLAMAALLTAIYSARQITLVFLGKARTKSAEHASENKPVMTLPLVVLAFFAVTAGWIGIPHSFPVLGQFSVRLAAGFPRDDVAVEELVEGHSSIPLIHLRWGLAGRAADWLVAVPQSRKNRGANGSAAARTGSGVQFRAE